MFLKKRSFWVTALILAQVACAPERSGLESSHEVAAVRALTKSEKEKDFDVFVEAFRTLYGPLPYKEKRFGFKFEEIVAEFTEKVKNAQSDEEFVGVLNEFATRFKDGHVGVSVPVGDASTVYKVPLFVIPVENRAIVAEVEDQSVTTTHGIEVGDEILEIDGVKPFDLLSIIKKYNTLGNEVTDQHFIFRALSRPAYMTELKPTRSTVRLKIAKPTGQILERELVWNVLNDEFTVLRPRVLEHPLTHVASVKAQEIISSANVRKMSDDVPFWLTPQVIRVTRMKAVAPSEETFKANLKAAGLPETTAMPKIFAAIYRFDGTQFGKGKTILITRIGTYNHRDRNEYPTRIAWYKALLEDYEPLIDALVIDQTHNGGGSLNYGLDFISLFVNGQARGVVNFLNADRRWLTGFMATSQHFSRQKVGELKNIADLGYRLVEQAIDKGLRLTEQPIPIGNGQYHIQSSRAGFGKPVLMLIDELSGSCGDLVPLVMKENGLATLFGERTGGWGGNVETVATLPNSSIELSLTRGLFLVYNPDGKYDLENGVVENNGVQPDIHYQHTVTDVRLGFINYVFAFSKAAASLEEK